MRMFRSIIGLTISAVLLLLASNTLASARCAVPSFENALKGSTAVFLGKAISESTDGQTRWFKFRATKVWKGRVAKTFTVGVAQNRTYPGWFRIGEDYLVFARSNSGRLYVDRCSRSRESEFAQQDLGKLGAGKKPR